MKNALRSQSGFSLIELMVSVGIMGVTSVLILGTFTDTFRMNQQVSNILNQKTDVLVGENVIFNDLRNIDPSFNVIDLRDDSGNGFYDYIPDVPEKFLRGQVSRKVTLKKDGLKEFYFLESDVAAGSLLIFDPVNAYRIGSAPADVNSAASLTFISLNQNAVIANQRPQFWKDGRLLMLDTPARVRPVVGGMVDLNVPPRSPVFIGQVGGPALSPLNGIQRLIRTAHPESGVPITSADQFLRTIPPVGGGQTFVRMRAVRIVRYSFQEVDPVRGWALYRSTLKGNEFVEPFMITDRLDSVVFSRRSVNQKLIEYLVNKVEQKIGGTQ